MNFGAPHTSRYPTKSRSCTDCLCAILFLLFSIASVGVAIYGFGKGDLQNIVQPYDSSGNPCGRNQTKAYPYLYLQTTNPLTWAKTTACIKACPTTPNDQLECHTNNEVSNCNDLEVKETYTFAKRFCWPKLGAMNISANAHGAWKKLGQEEAYGDIMDSWRVLLISFGVAFILSLLYLFLLEQCAVVIIALVIVLFIAGLTFLGYFFHKAYLDLKAKSINHDDPSKTYLYLAYGVWIVEGIFLILFCCLWSRLKLAGRIIQATADYLTDVKRVIFIPILFNFCLLVYLAWWMYSGAHIFSIGENRYDPGSIWGEMKWTPFIKVLWYFYMFALLWHVAFIINLDNFVIAAVAVIWYFAPDRHNLNSPICRALSWGLFTHVGTVAFGALLLAIIWAIQIVLAYIHKKVKEAEKKGHVPKYISWIIGCLQCCAACFERIIRYISRHAYVETIIRSVGFCKGAQNAFGIVTGNVLRFGTLAGITELATIFGKILIAALATLIGHFLLQWEADYSNVIFETIYPLIVRCILTIRLCS